MKKKLFYLLFFASTITNGMGQCINKHMSNNLKQEKMKALLFKDNLEKSTIYADGFKLPDGSEMLKSDDKDFYYFHITLPNSPYGTKYIYFKNSLQLKVEYNLFYEAIIGTVKIYDEPGNLIQEINYDADYAFSTQNLIDKMLSEFQIDLLHPTRPQKIKINRGFDDRPGFPSRFYSISLEDIHGSRRMILDGNSGNVISDGYITLEE